MALENDNFDKYLVAECQAIEARRAAIKKLGLLPDAICTLESTTQEEVHAPSLVSTADDTSTPISPDGTPSAIAPLDRDYCGLALSGGGIRSATFGLGVLQGLAKVGMLQRFDYLSTVSGGGYIGGWLSAWIRAKGLRRVINDMQAKNYVVSAHHAEAPEIRHLRYYSNYLAPYPSLFSVDGWVLISIYARNLILNFAVMLLALLGFFGLTRSVVELYTIAAQSPPLLWSVRVDCLTVALAVLAALVVFSGAYLVSPAHDPSLSLEGERKRFNRFSVAPKIVLIFLLSLVVTFPSARQSLMSETWLTALTLCTIGNAIFQSIVGLVAMRVRLIGAITGGCSGAIVGGVAAALLHLLLCGTADVVVATMAVVAVPAIACGFVLTQYLHIGFMGQDLREDEREWFSAIDARLLVFSVIWAFILALSVYGPWLVATILSSNWSHAITILVSSSWIGSTLAGLWAARGSDASPSRPSRTKVILAKTAPYVFLAGMMILVSTAATWVMYDAYDSMIRRTRPGELPETFLNSASALLTNLNDHRKDVVIEPVWIPVIFVLLSGSLLCLFLSWLLGDRVGVNRFSLHNLYMNRLVRCYLGAARKRSPNVATNFDRYDDIPLSSLPPNGSILSDELIRPALDDDVLMGPVHIFNAAINRSVGGVVAGNEADTLGLRDRLAESFVLTPTYCGSTASGYSPTECFADNVRLGTAMAVSGAAVSPNMGPHSSPAITALLTLFNLRLGAWFGNPSRKSVREEANPPASWLYFLRELFGRTDATSEFVYVSDGGHFENMGVYELLRRRCRYIVAVDAGADAGFLCENLGNLVRKARVDLGIEIDIDPTPTKTDATGIAQSHFVFGRIRYAAGGERSAEDRTFTFADSQFNYERNEGLLVYIKSCMTGDEAADLRNYQREEPEFPNQPTTDQFYDESQFESYRALGEHTIESFMHGSRSNFGDHRDRLATAGRLMDGDLNSTSEEAKSAFEPDLMRLPTRAIFEKLHQTFLRSPTL